MNNLDTSTELVTKEELLAYIRIKPLIINYCSICTFPCAFYYENGVFGYDSGCDCEFTSYEGWKPRSENELDFYLDPKNGWLEVLTKFVRGK